MKKYDKSNYLMYLIINYKNGIRLGKLVKIFVENGANVNNMFERAII